VLALAIVALVVLSVASQIILREALRDERARTATLLALLEAKAAPVEFAAYGHPIYPDEAPPALLYTDDGLISVEES
jgi:hypothetical protein